MTAGQLSSVAVATSRVPRLHRGPASVPPRRCSSVSRLVSLLFFFPCSSRVEWLCNIDEDNAAFFWRLERLDYPWGDWLTILNEPEEKTDMDLVENR